MGALLINLGLCLSVLVAPALLVIYTAGYIYTYQSFDKVKPFLLLNIFLAVGVIVLVVLRQVSTLTVMAIVGYGLAFLVVLATVAGVVITMTWRRILALTRVRPIIFRKRQDAPSESSLQY